jgi:hypothetical protein
MTDWPSIRNATALVGILAVAVMLGSLWMGNRPTPDTPTPDTPEVITSEVPEVPAPAAPETPAVPPGSWSGPPALSQPGRNVSQVVKSDNGLDYWWDAKRQQYTHSRTAQYPRATGDLAPAGQWELLASARGGKPPVRSQPPRRRMFGR